MNTKFKEFSKDIFSRHLSKLACVIIILVMTIGNLQYKFWNDPDRIIYQDVLQYYLYLPSSVIYKDISLQFVRDDHEFFGKRIYGHYVPETDRFVAKMSMGLSYLYAPFFFGAHAVASLSDYEADGFSAPYKIALIISSLVFIALGLFSLRKILLMYFSDKTAALTLLIIGLGTNLYFYAVIEPTMSHAYNFGLISTFLLLLIKWLKKRTFLNSLFLGLIIGIIVLIRPSNIVILTLIIFWEVGSWTALKNRIIFLFSSWRFILMMLLGSVVIVIPQMLYWNYITGHYIYYSYGDEGFFFMEPKFIDGLFSYRKGWLVYTPLMVFSIFGMILLAIRKREWFYPIFIYSLLSMYIMFSWWCWWYGGGFGMRPMVDSYGILAIPLAAFVAWIFEKKKIFVLIFFIVVAWFIFLNIFQTRQYYLGSVHFSGMNKNLYWENFLKLDKVENFNALIKFPDYEKAKEGIYLTMEESKFLAVQDSIQREKFIEQFSLNVRENPEYWQDILEKSERWNESVEEVIRKDAKWLWEVRREDREKEQQQNKN